MIQYDRKLVIIAEEKEVSVFQPMIDKRLSKLSTGKPVLRSTITTAKRPRLINLYR